MTDTKLGCELYSVANTASNWKSVGVVLHAVCHTAHVISLDPVRRGTSSRPAVVAWDLGQRMENLSQSQFRDFLVDIGQNS